MDRERFIKSIIGTAVCFSCFPYDSLAIDEKLQDNKNKEYLAGVCGTYCGACPAYIAKHSNEEQLRLRMQKRISSGQVKTKTIPDPAWMDGLLCDGCMSGGQLAPHCQRCAIKSCVAGKQDVIRCSDCTELPCFRITNMINTGLLHRAEYLPNLQKIRKMGVQEWVKYEEERWLCPGCGKPLSWYDPECPACGEKRSGKLFPLAINNI